MEGSSRDDESVGGDFGIPKVDEMTMEEINLLLEIDEMNPEGGDAFEPGEDAVKGPRFTRQ